MILSKINLQLTCENKSNVIYCLWLFFAVCGGGGVERNEQMWNWCELSLIVQSNAISSSVLVDWTLISNGKNNNIQTKINRLTFLHSLYDMLRSMFIVQCVAAASFFRHLIFNIYWFVIFSSLFVVILNNLLNDSILWWFLIFSNIYF